MTQLLKQTVAHSTIPKGIPLGPQPTTSPLKSFKSCGQLSKSHQNVQNSDFQSIFYVKNDPNLSKKNS